MQPSSEPTEPPAWFAYTGEPQPACASAVPALTPAGVSEVARCVRDLPCRRQLINNKAGRNKRREAEASRSNVEATGAPSSSASAPGAVHAAASEPLVKAKRVRKSGTKNVRWTLQEEAQLKELATALGRKGHWESIAQQLGTNRTAYAVEQHFNLYLNVRPPDAKAQPTSTIQAQPSTAEVMADHASQTATAAELTVVELPLVQAETLLSLPGAPGFAGGAPAGSELPSGPAPWPAPPPSDASAAPTEAVPLLPQTEDSPTDDGELAAEEPPSAQ